MINIYIDKKKYKVKKNINLLQACLSHSIDIPYFCWHPKLGSIGSCRQCAVKIYEDKNDDVGKLIMSCMTPVKNNQIISTNDKESKKFRKMIIELLMTNHPHDCPICEEGGNCHLQDMTVMTQHNVRRYKFSKKHYKSQFLGSFISHEMNRCISCYRCVRFYNDYAGGKDFGVYGISNNLYFGRIQSGTLESEFSGNLIEICPTGVFTDKVHSKKYNRKWDMQNAPSICQHCSIGCNLIIGERYGELRKIDNRYNTYINKYFICDLGRFGYGYNNLHNRPFIPIFNHKKKNKKLDIKTAIKYASKIINTSSNVIGIGSSRTSIENNFALYSMVGKKNFSTGISEKYNKSIKLIIETFKKSNLDIPSISDIEKSDLILILGENVSQTAPIISLAIRQAVKNNNFNKKNKNNIYSWQFDAIKNINQNLKSNLFITNVTPTGLDDVSKYKYFDSIEKQCIFACNIANNINKTFPKIKNFNKKLLKITKKISKKLLLAKNPLIISGISSGSLKLIKSAINISYALKSKGSFVKTIILPLESNDIGLGLIGGISLDKVLDKCKNNLVDTIIIMENDIYRFLTKKNVNIIKKNVNNIILIDHQFTKTSKISNLLLPSMTSIESSGTIVNYESRPQRFFKVYEPSFYDKNKKQLEGWRWIDKIKQKINNTGKSYINIDKIVDYCISEIPILKNIKYVSPKVDFRIFNQKIARSHIRYSGRTSMMSNVCIHEKSQPEDIDSMFSFSTDGLNNINCQTDHIPFVWYPGWNSPQSIIKYKKIFHNNFHKKKIILFKYINNIKNSPFILKIKEHSIKKWKIIPYYLLFGCHYLTQLTKIIRDKNIKVYGIINNLDGIRYGFLEEEKIEFTCLSENFYFYCRYSKYMKPGHIGLPLGMKHIPLSLSMKFASDLRKKL
ncbi:NADH-quinone oxidoreductase subunit NuoG [Buchnera aphidicola (Taiwanaphis decaspermi)]|uniref:NADH-quinone oxidoreductase subunit NuoG n=1 Tax=Buchnera aphidicola TaxID=9 RepID=UPI0031B84FA0